MESYHQLLHWILHQVGHQIGDKAPEWLHPVLHVVLIWAPLVMIALVLVRVARRFRKGWRVRDTQTSPPVPDLPIGFRKDAFRFVWAFSRGQQIVLIGLGLFALPVLYASLELPKLIINSALAEEHSPATLFGAPISQTTHLFVLSGFYLLAVLGNGTLKFAINVYKGGVGERLLRRLRLMIYRLWRSGAGPARRAEVIPLIAQEVEPIGGFASDAFALPVFQGGTFITILVFMFMQDPVLGAAAVTLLPIQLALIPRLQRRVNVLARSRAAEVRALGGELGDQASVDSNSARGAHPVGTSLKRIEQIRRKIHRSKFFIKSLNNFLTSLTPFFFYSIGGYLVIEGRLTLGALVAVLAAYKDFSAPLKELFRFYQSSEDVRIRYEEMLRFLGAGGNGSDSQSAQRRELSAPPSVAEFVPNPKLETAEIT